MLPAFVEAVTRNKKYELLLRSGHPSPEKATFFDLQMIKAQPSGCAFII
jgi:hypothetical protein